MGMQRQGEQFHVHSVIRLKDSKRPKALPAWTTPISFASWESILDYFGAIALGHAPAHRFLHIEM